LPARQRFSVGLGYGSANSSARDGTPEARVRVAVAGSQYAADRGDEYAAGSADKLLARHYFLRLRRIFAM
jgi:hypothetical protein